MNNQAKLEIMVKLSSLREDTRRKVRMNMYAMKKLVEEQTSLKRQVVEYTKLLRVINSPKEK